MIKFITTLLPLMLLLQGCAAPKMKVFNAKKTVQKESGALGSIYKQDAEVLQIFSLYNGLAEKSSTRESANTAKLLMFTGMILAGVGGFELGSGGDAVAGIGLIGAGFGVGYYADLRLQDAVVQHNKSLAAANQLSLPLLLAKTWQF